MTNRFTQAQVTELARSVGFNSADARIAGAIAMCEAPYSANGHSYADYDMIGDQALANDTWGFSYGAFQVRSLRRDKGTGSFRDEIKLADPLFNTRAALWIRQNQGFRAWSTYNTGQYRAWLQDIYPPAPGTYVVLSGDSLTRIVAKLGGGFVWQDLARVNGLHDPYVIYIGQVLLLPWFVYTVVAGDTLAKIAATYGNGVTFAEIADFNGITDPSKISVGQVIRIPRAEL